jgi:hypothetical protein
VLRCEYSFGPGTATSIAVRSEAGIIVVSPPCNAADSVFDELAAIGPVCALVAPNAFHHMGLVSWKARFQNAVLFAPEQSIARVRAKTGLREIRPVNDANAVTGKDIEWIDMPYYRTGEVLVRLRTEHGLAWHVTDAILNFPELPLHPIARLLFRLTGSAPGLKLNRIAPVFMVKDRGALYRWLLEQLESEPPRWLIPSHGDVADLSSTSAPLRAILAAR